MDPNFFLFLFFLIRSSFPPSSKSRWNSSSLKWNIKNLIAIDIHLGCCYMVINFIYFWKIVTYLVRFNSCNSTSACPIKSSLPTTSLSKTYECKCIYYLPYVWRCAKLGIIYAMKKIRVQPTWNVIGLNGLSTWVTNVSAHIGLHVFFFSKVWNSLSLPWTHLTYGSLVPIYNEKLNDSLM